MGLERKHRRVLRRIFEVPPPGDLSWEEVLDALQNGLGVEVWTPASGKVHLDLKGEYGQLDRLLPDIPMPREQVRMAREWLELAGVDPWGA